MSLNPQIQEEVQPHERKEKPQKLFLEQASNFEKMKNQIMHLRKQGVLIL